MDPSNGHGRTPRGPRNLLGAAVVAAALCGVVLVASSAGAAEHKVTLCHATASARNPYVSITVDTHSVTQAGHGSHEGPVYSVGTEERWGDVIPAFDLGDGRTYPGQNLDDAGLALLADGCAATPASTTTASIPNS